nr:hypothetical protein [Bacteroidota bacterium]
MKKTSTPHLLSSLQKYWKYTFLLVFVAVSSPASAQFIFPELPIAYYDFQNDTSLNTGENTPQFNSTRGTLPNFVQTTGSGTVSPGYVGGYTPFGSTNYPDGRGVSFTGWDSTAVTTPYIEIPIDTRGYADLKIIVVVRKNSTASATLFASFSSTGTGGTFTSTAGSSLTNNDVIYTFDLTSVTALENNEDAVVRLYITTTDPTMGIYFDDFFVVAETVVG